MNTVIPIDLTQRPPRSHCVRLGGYVMLPRILDKGRALNEVKSAPAATALSCNNSVEGGVAG
ncbi:MAG TPA: DUF5069 domain-containing protein [Rariglobus sp.]